MYVSFKEASRPWVRARLLKPWATSFSYTTNQPLSTYVVTAYMEGQESVKVDMAHLSLTASSEGLANCNNAASPALRHGSNATLRTTATCRDRCTYCSVLQIPLVREMLHLYILTPGRINISRAQCRSHEHYERVRPDPGGTT